LLLFCALIGNVQPCLAQVVDRSLEAKHLVERARSLEHGEGVPRDMARAIELYCDAAKLGDSDAQYNLGWIYANGRGVERNDGLAAIFFAMASATGVAQADQMLRVVGAPSSETADCLRAPAEAVRKEPPPTEQQADRFERAPKHIVRLVNRLGPEYGVDPQLALAVIEVESNYNPNARSPRNAQGLMQLIPETSDRFGVKKPFDPEQNLRGGLAYLRWLLAYFRGSVALVAAGYNAGEGAVDRYRGVPPYAETVAYVQRIRRLLQQDRHPFDERVAMPSVALSKLNRTSLLSQDSR
jgi:soluble lytic murein transglycosylase-like protein